MCVRTRGRAFVRVDMCISVYGCGCLSVPVCLCLCLCLRLGPGACAVVWLIAGRGEAPGEKRGLVRCTSVATSGPKRVQPPTNPDRAGVGVDAHGCVVECVDVVRAGMIQTPGLSFARTAHAGEVRRAVRWLCVEVRGW